MSYKILVADDEKEVVSVISKKLQLHGYDVVEAYDGQEAIEKVNAEDPDVILLDLNMPKLNGFEALREIRQNYTKKWVPVIIVSANSDLAAVNKSYGLEADHYLTKPCEFDLLLNGVETMISLIPLRKQEKK